MLSRKGARQWAIKLSKRRGGAAIEAASDYAKTDEPVPAGGSRDSYAAAASEIWKAHERRRERVNSRYCLEQNLVSRLWVQTLIATATLRGFEFKQPMILGLTCYT